MFLKYKKRAFTFIEILIVVIILGIISTLSIPSLRSFYNTIKVELSAQTFVSLINYLKYRSITEGKIIFLVFDNQKNNFLAYFQGSDRPFKIYHFSKDININLKESNEELNFISFYPDGRIDSKEIVISLANRHFILQTKNLTGKVQLTKL